MRSEPQKKPEDDERKFKKTLLATTMVADLAREIGLDVHVEPNYGYVGQIRRPDGKTFYFRNTSFDLNGQGAADNAKDKGYAAYFMERMGYPVPRGDVFYSDEWALQVKSGKDSRAACGFADVLGYPVIVKPNSKSQGMGVEKVHSQEDLMRGLDVVFNTIHDRVAVVQEYIPGDDYRIVVLDDEVIAAYRRSPLTVIGDGLHTIGELLLQKQQKFIQMGRDTVIKLDDPKMLRKLHRANLGVETVLPENSEKTLLDNANLSSGGDADDVTDQMHPTFKEMAIRLSRDMGLRYSGVDVITQQDVSSAIDAYHVIEINAAPGLDYYVEMGDRQRTAVRDMYKKVLLAMINS